MVKQRCYIMVKQSTNNAGSGNGLNIEILPTNVVCAQSSV